VPKIARGDAVALTRELVRVDSRNPTLVSGAPGEARAAHLLADVLTSWGFRVELREAAPGRPNVIARAGSAQAQHGAPSLLFNGHIDVVGVEGMAHAPWDGVERDGRIYGRGATDMKAGVAAMCAAAVRAVDTRGDAGGLNGEIILTAVVDEEYSSIGTRALITDGIRADAAIVTEPTRLAIMPAHKGFVWVDVLVHGRAAHGSRWDVGVDAIRHAGLLLAELDRYDAEILPVRDHPLLGRPSLHASTITGGIGLSTYPDRCHFTIERRTIPGETTAEVLAEMQGACDRVRQRRPELSVDLGLIFEQPPSDVSTDAPIVRALEGALRACAEEVRITGMSAWTDAALLNEAGIPAICFGPGDISLAHAAEEYVRIDEIERATLVLAALAVRWMDTNRNAA
jgi:acetylornithine deacetylase